MSVCEKKEALVRLIAEREAGGMDMTDARHSLGQIEAALRFTMIDTTRANRIRVWREAGAYPIAIVFSTTETAFRLFFRGHMTDPDGRVGVASFALVPIQATRPTVATLTLSWRRIRAGYVLSLEGINVPDPGWPDDVVRPMASAALEHALRLRPDTRRVIDGRIAVGGPYEAALRTAYEETGITMLQFPPPSQTKSAAPPPPEDAIISDDDVVELDPIVDNDVEFVLPGRRLELDYAVLVPESPPRKHNVLADIIPESPPPLPEIQFDNEEVWSAFADDISQDPPPGDDDDGDDDDDDGGEDGGENGDEDMGEDMGEDRGDLPGDDLPNSFSDDDDDDDDDNFPATQIVPGTAPGYDAAFENRAHYRQGLRPLSVPCDRGQVYEVPAKLRAFKTRPEQAVPPQDEEDGVSGPFGPRQAVAKLVRFPRLEIRASTIAGAGCGLFAGEPIRRNQLITEYGGVQLRSGRQPGELPQTHTIALLGGISVDSYRLDGRTFAEAPFRLGDYIARHQVLQFANAASGRAFPPNGRLSTSNEGVFIVDRHNNGWVRPRRYLVATKPIGDGEEIFFEYLRGINDFGI